jgi:hypothetical protein
MELNLLFYVVRSHELYPIELRAPGVHHFTPASEPLHLQRYRNGTVTH